MNNLKNIIIVALAIVPSLAYSQTDISPSAEDVAAKEKIYSPYVERTVRNSDFAEGVYWGDTHLHTRSLLSERQQYHQPLHARV